MNNLLEESNILKIKNWRGATFKKNKTLTECLKKPAGYLEIIYCSRNKYQDLIRKGHISVSRLNRWAAFYTAQMIPKGCAFTLKSTVKIHSFVQQNSKTFSKWLGTFLQIEADIILGLFWPLWPWNWDILGFQWYI